MPLRSPAQAIGVRRTIYCLTENDGLVIVHHHPVFQVIAQSAGKYHFFHIFTEANEVFDIIAMTYAHHVLFDDRTSVQFFGYIVASCTNEFDPANCSLVIWTGSNKGRQKAVMNIDHPARILLAEAGGQYLHITSQDNTICILFLHQTSNLVKSRSLVLRVDRNMMEGNTMPLDH